MPVTEATYRLLAAADAPEVQWELVLAQLSPWELREVCAAAAFLPVAPGEVAGDTPAAVLV